MLSIALRSHRNISYCSSVYGCEDRISHLWSWMWIWTGNGKKSLLEMETLAVAD